MEHQQAIDEIKKRFAFVHSFITPLLFQLLILIVIPIDLKINSWQILIAA